MPAKILSSLTDEKRNHHLRKQIGCILQIFDRRHLLSSSSRRVDQTKQDVLEQHKEKKQPSSISPRVSSDPRIARNEKEKEPKAPQSPNIFGDVVKDSMYYREAAAAAAAAVAHSNKQHVDSRRPMTRRRRGDVEQSSMDDMIAPRRRLSLDGREAKSTRLKELLLPRLSLDSRAASSINFSPCTSSSESRLDFLDVVEYENYPAASRRRSSSVVAKLMGLEPYPDERIYSISTNPKEIHHLPPAKDDARSPASTSRRLLRCGDSFQSSSCSPSSSSVYGEIEKRIAEIEFNKSGKDLRSLKQIVGAMQQQKKKTRDRQIEPSSTASTVDEILAPRTRRNSSGTYVGLDPMPRWQKGKIKGPTSGAMVDHVLHNAHRLPNPRPKSNKETTTSTTSTHRRKERARAPQEPDGRLSSSINNKVVVRSKMEKARGASKAKKSGTISVKSSVISSSSFQQQSLSHDEELTRPAASSTKHLSKKVVERNSQDMRLLLLLNLKPKSPLPPPPPPPPLPPHESNEVISGTGTCSSYQDDGESHNSECASPTEADNCVERRRQKHLKIRRVESMEEILSIDQPSPVSVLDYTSEDPPSPVRKITLACQDDEDHVSNETENLISYMAAGAYYRDSQGSHVVQKSSDMTVDEIHIGKNMSGGLYTHHHLMKEESKSKTKVQDRNIDYGIDDGMLKLIIASDILKHESWTRWCKSEIIPALALDLERLIFKDLVNDCLPIR